MGNCVTRFTLLTLLGFSLIISAMSFSASGQTQQQKRTVIKKPWRVEPVSVVAIKTRNNENIETGREFEDDDNWLDGFTITVANNYDKAVTALTIEMVFRREHSDTRPPFAHVLRFGPSPNTREYLRRDPNKVINVGKTVDFQISAENYKGLRHDLEQTGYSDSIKRVELVITEVGFEDGSMLYSGKLYLQDSAYPNDPTKKIPARRRPGAQNQKTTRPRDSRNVKTGIRILKTSLTSPDPWSLRKGLQGEECMDQGGTSQRRKCDISDNCSISDDILAHFRRGNGQLSLESYAARCCNLVDGLAVVEALLHDSS